MDDDKVVLTRPAATPMRKTGRREKGCAVAIHTWVVAKLIMIIMLIMIMILEIIMILIIIIIIKLMLWQPRPGDDPLHGPFPHPQRGSKRSTLARPGGL